MARSSDYYILYYTWARVRRGYLLEQIQLRRGNGWGDKEEQELYGQVKELSLYLWSLESYFVGNLTALEADVIIDRIVEITQLNEGVNFTVYPCVRTYNVETSSEANLSLFSISNQFRSLTDTFSSFTGRALQFLQINGGETAITSKALTASDSSYTPGAAGTSLTATNVKDALDQIDAAAIAATSTVSGITTWKNDVDSTGTGIVVKFANSPTNPRYIKRTIANGTNISWTNGDGVAGNPTGNVSMTPTFTTVTTTGNLSVGGNITVTGLVDGIDISIADGLNLKRSGGQNSMSQNIDMNALYKVVNATAATANGEYTVYQQVVRTTSDQAGITGVKEFDNQTVFKAAIIKDNVPLTETVTVDTDEQMIVGSGFAVNGTLVVNGQIFFV